MRESSRPLRKVVEELRESLESADDLDVGARTALEEALEQMRGVLDESSREGDSDALRLSESLRSRLSQALSRFEGSHPKLTAAVGRLLDQLAELGI